FCKDIDIPNIYKDKEDFKKRYPFDPENPDSIISNLNRAYDNAIVLRESITSESLAFIQLAIYEMNKAAASRSPLIELMRVNDNLLAFYGIIDDQIDSENVRNIIKAGKRIERVDLYARLGVGRKELLREVHRMIPRVERSGLEYSKDKLKAVTALVEQENIDYYKIVDAVESILS
ncbi:MAG: alpha-E domain-containing protein, partial [Lachnospiraceae bacterium]